MATDEVQQISPQAQHSGWMQHPAFRRIAILVLSAVAVAGLTGFIQPGLVQPAVAQAYTIQGPNQVGWGRAAILFNREETRQIGFGAAPGGLAPTNPAVAAFLVARMGLAAIAMNYYNRGLCSAYTWSVRPWDNQGFMSRKC
ncbi:MAG: hypothetical protein CL424_09760 [Acidimicrobiaceae bacterium]|nr:hypothetical protein [Acidimicrobiaceae bacterium]